MAPMRVARRIVVSGRVQGVGFRYFTQDTALREGVTGWVRNLPDGRVEAHVEGEIEAVARVEAGGEVAWPHAWLTPSASTQHASHARTSQRSMSLPHPH